MENTCRRSRSRCRKRRRSKHSARRRSDSSKSNSVRESLQIIVSRLNALENRESSALRSETPPLSAPQAPTVGNSTEKIVDAINSLKSVHTQRYYVSNFDPKVHNVDAWFEEVDRAQSCNKWDDSECLSRVGTCLKGDASTWLNDWVTTDRTWSNFKRDFKSLCVNKIDVAGILYDVMCTDSDQYTTYADYARRSLLRLKVVKGLSDDLISAIVVRGIKNPHVKACATNANLSCNELVSFLSTFVKPVHMSRSNRPSHNIHRHTHPKSNLKRPATIPSKEVKCFKCGESGHKAPGCPKRDKKEENLESKDIFANKNDRCSFCKKNGHDISRCFAKQRSESRNPKNVNFCSAPNERQCSDTITAVIQGIPTDVLIDTGALNVSLISSAVVNHFSCARKPIFCVLKGVGTSITKVSSYVTLPVEFSEITLEIDLLVVPSESMNAPIIIGTDVLNRDGVTFVRTKNQQLLTRDQSVNNVSTVVLDKQSLPVNTSLVGDDREKLLRVVSGFSDSMISGTAASTVTTGSMQIRVNSEVPVCYRPYKMSFDEKQKVRAIIHDLKSKGIIRDSESEYASPVLLVKKKNGSDRMCVDFRALNKITVKDRFPLPLIDDHIDRLGKSKFFTVLDMASGFHQIPLTEDSIKYTGFVTSEGHYEYLKMPYGLANAPVIFQRIISNTLRKFIELGSVVVYIDDVMLLSANVDEGLELLRDVLDTLTRAGFSINVHKCSFLCTEVEYLGRIISNGVVKPSKSKIEALVKAPIPENVKQIRQFLGLAGYFRRYIPNFARKTACIARLTRKDAEFIWGPEQELARTEIITCLTNEPILAIFDPQLPTELHTDASSAGYGALLLQTHQDGQKRVVAYFSKVTQGAEPRYHSYELETLAVVKALQHFRHYLLGLKFKIVTDCNALKATQFKKDLLPRVARWWMYLQDFNFEIEYRKGVLLSHADYLSRNPIVNNVTKPRNWAQIAQSADDETQKLFDLLSEGKLDTNRYVKRNDILYYNYTPVGEESRLLCFVPKGYRLSLLRVFHDEHSHINAEKTTDLILKHFWFPGLRQFVIKYISHCIVCLSCKRVPRAPLQPINSWFKPDDPFHTVHIDVLGPLPESKGYKHVVVLVDAFTKYALLYAIYRQDTVELLRVFNNAISLFGTPKLLVVDRGRMFESTEFTKWVSNLGCEIYHITPEMHHSNAQVERYVRTVLNMLRIEANHTKSEWSDELWRLQLVLNITKQKTTQVSPLNLLIGSETTTPIVRALIRDIALEVPRKNRESFRTMTRQRTAERLRQNQAAQDEYTNKDRRPPRVFNVNDFVFVIKISQSQGKLDSGMRGPYRVEKVLKNDRYELKLLAGSYGKTTCAAAQFMVPWRGEWTPETCSALFECKFSIIIVWYANLVPMPAM